MFIDFSNCTALHGYNCLHQLTCTHNTILYHYHCYRWDFFPQQFSDPVYLEAGKYYYFEVISNQGGGPWDIGLAAKIHSLNHTAYPYQGDKEQQRIEIRSNVVRENIVSRRNDSYIL